MRGRHVCAEYSCDRVQLVTNANENERGDEYVEHRIAGQEYEHAVRVGREPNVMRAHEELEGDATEPAEQRTALLLYAWYCVAQYHVRHDLL